jgi:uncharacterized protein YjiS (DUF1127 family)
MSTITFTPASPAISSSVRALFRWPLAAVRPQGRLYRSLKDLPDHLLLDIGVDPRDVPGNSDQVNARPELLWHGATAKTSRTTAKS